MIDRLALRRYEVEPVGKGNLKISNWQLESAY
jgi:hypothetical protein